MVGSFATPAVTAGTHVPMGRIAPDAHHATDPQIITQWQAP